VRPLRRPEPGHCARPRGPRPYPKGWLITFTPHCWILRAYLALKFPQVPTSTRSITRFSGNYYLSSLRAFLRAKKGQVLTLGQDGIFQLRTFKSYCDLYSVGKTEAQETEEQLSKRTRRSFKGAQQLFICELNVYLYVHRL
jgi:hypothetical protein